MSYIDEILEEVANNTPKQGFNVCLFDEFGEEKLILLEHFEDKSEAEEYAKEFEGELVYIYGGSATEGYYEDEGVKHWWDNADRGIVQQITGFDYKPYDNLNPAERKQVDIIYSGEATGINRDWDKDDKRNIPQGYQLDDFDEETGFRKEDPYQMMMNQKNTLDKTQYNQYDKTSYNWQKGQEVKYETCPHCDGGGKEKNGDSCEVCFGTGKIDLANKTDGVEGFNKEDGSMVCDKCGRVFDPNDDWMMDNYNKHMRSHIGEAIEGGKGSGRKGHAPWMLSGEAVDECPNCMIQTERKDGKCILCGN